MNVNRGDVVLTRVPHVSGGRGKKRPAVVVQADVYKSPRQTIVVEITSNLTEASDPANLLIDVTTSDGQATGLTRDSVASCFFISTVNTDLIQEVIGKMSPSLMLQLDQCLKTVLGL